MVQAPGHGGGAAGQGGEATPIDFRGYCGIKGGLQGADRGEESRKGISKALSSSALHFRMAAGDLIQRDR